MSKAGVLNDLFLLSSKSDLESALHKLNKGIPVSKHIFRDLKILRLIDDRKNLSETAQKLLRLEHQKEHSDAIKELVLQLPKYQVLEKLVLNNPKIKTKQLFALLPDGFFGPGKATTQKNYLSRMRSWIQMESVRSSQSLFSTIT